MRKGVLGAMRVTLIGVTGVAVAGCAMDRLIPSSHAIGAPGTVTVAQGDRPNKIDQLSYIAPAPDCRELPGITASITRQPAYGRAEIVRTRDFSPYPPGNTSAGCNSRRVPVWQVIYTPAPGYRGPDRFTYVKALGDQKTDVLVTLDVR